MTAGSSDRLVVHPGAPVAEPDLEHAPGAALDRRPELSGRLRPELLVHAGPIRPQHRLLTTALKALAHARGCRQVESGAELPPRPACAHGCRDQPAQQAVKHPRTRDRSPPTAGTSRCSDPPDRPLHGDLVPADTRSVGIEHAAARGDVELPPVPRAAQDLALPLPDVLSGAARRHHPVIRPRHSGAPWCGQVLRSAYSDPLTLNTPIERPSTSTILRDPAVSRQIRDEMRGHQPSL